jgi:hypothetical protein
LAWGERKEYWSISVEEEEEMSALNNGYLGDRKVWVWGGYYDTEHESPVLYKQRLSPHMSLQSLYGLVERELSVPYSLAIKNDLFWNVTPCGSCKNRRFGGTKYTLYFSVACIGG